MTKQHQPTEEDIKFAIELVAKIAYDSKQNPYFDFDGHHFDMPEAIIYMLKNAESQILACGDARAWSDARIAETVDVPFEADENMSPGVARAHGFEPTQIAYMKAAHEYYLTHVTFTGKPCKTYPELQKTNFDVDKIFRLARAIPREFWGTCSFEEAHRKGLEDAVPLLG